MTALLLLTAAMLAFLVVKTFLPGRLARDMQTGLLLGLMVLAPLLCWPWLRLI